MRSKPAKTVSKALALILTLWSSHATAERLVFDHRLYPALKDVLDSGRTEMTAFNDSNPKFILDRIAVQGTSAQSWTEAIEIVARAPSKAVPDAQAWMAEVQTRAAKSCPGAFEILASDSQSVTFAHRSSRCQGDASRTALYRIVTGKRSLFMLNPIYKGEMGDASQQQWLALLASAHLD